MNSNKEKPVQEMIDEFNKERIEKYRKLKEQMLEELKKKYNKPGALDDGIDARMGSHHELLSEKLELVIADRL